MGKSPPFSAPSLRALDIAMIAITTFFVALRFWSRALQRNAKGQRFWWDDWTVLMALVRCLASFPLIDDMKI